MKQESEANDLVTVSEFEIILYPELMAAALKRRELDLYLSWYVLKIVDAQRSGSGHFEFNSFKRILSEIAGSGKSECYNKFADGCKIYWMPLSGKNGSKSSSFVSNIKVSRHLSPTMS